MSTQLCAQNVQKMLNKSACEAMLQENKNFSLDARCLKGDGRIIITRQFCWFVNFFGNISSTNFCVIDPAFASDGQTLGLQSHSGMEWTEYGGGEKRHLVFHARLT